MLLQKWHCLMSHIKCSYARLPLWTKETLISGTLLITKCFHLSMIGHKLDWVYFQFSKTHPSLSPKTFHNLLASSPCSLFSSSLVQYPESLKCQQRLCWHPYEWLMPLSNNRIEHRRPSSSLLHFYRLKNYFSPPRLFLFFSPTLFQPSLPSLVPQLYLNLG